MSWNRQRQGGRTRRITSFDVCMSGRPFHVAVDVPFEGKAKDVVTEPDPGRRVRHCEYLLPVGRRRKKSMYGVLARWLPKG